MTITEVIFGFLDFLNSSGKLNIYLAKSAIFFYLVGLKKEKIWRAPIAF